MKLGFQSRQFDPRSWHSIMTLYFDPNQIMLFTVGNPMISTQECFTSERDTSLSPCHYDDITKIFDY